MLNMPYEVAMACRRIDATVEQRAATTPRWTWIAGRRYRAVGRS